MTLDDFAQEAILKILAGLDSFLSERVTSPPRHRASALARALDNSRITAGVTSLWTR